MDLSPRNHAFEAVMSDLDDWEFASDEDAKVTIAELSAIPNLSGTDTSFVDNNEVEIYRASRVGLRSLLT